MLDCSAKAGRPRFDIADIVREHRAQLEATVQLCATQKRVFSAVELCRTEALGGHIDRCHACGSTTPAYNSCRNRHKGKMLDWLRTAKRRGAFDTLDDFLDPEAFDRLTSRLASRNWVAYAKKPFRDSNHVIKYLARYTHRVAIANGRIADITESNVAFRTKSGKVLSITPVEFLRRFCLHVLPPGFNKIRHYGLYASAALATTHLQAKDTLVPANAATGAPSASDTPLTVELSWQQQLRALTGRDVDCCRYCGALVEHLPIARPFSRAPPRQPAAT